MTDTLSYQRPDTLEQALAALRARGVRVAAGCTDLFPATEAKVLAGPVLDITNISALRGIETTADGLRIGAATTWADILTAPLPAAFDGLKLAAREVGAKQIQNRGTIGGNLCNASPAADGVPPLLTLDAVVELASTGGTRRLALQDFLTGPRQTARRSDELLTAVHIPVSATEGHGAFLKLGARSYLVISIAMTAVRVHTTGGKVSDVAVAVGACGPVATRLPEVEVALRGHAPDPSRIDAQAVARALSPIDDVRADAVYRAHAAAELLRRTFDMAVSNASGGAG